jgi:hypothetical protein
VYFRGLNTRHGVIKNGQMWCINTGFVWKKNYQKVSFCGVKIPDFEKLPDTESLYDFGRVKIRLLISLSLPGRDPPGGAPAERLGVTRCQHTTMWRSSQVR